MTNYLVPDMPCKHFINVIHKCTKYFTSLFQWHARLVGFQHAAMDMLSNRHVATLHAASCAEMLSEATLAASCKLASEGVESGKAT